MNRSPLLAVALVLTVAPLAHAQAPKKPALVAAPLDCLKGVRAHAAMMRAQPLALPPAVVRAPQAVPPKPWGQSSSFTVTAGAPSQGAGSGCSR